MSKSVWRKAAELVDRHGVGCCDALDAVLWERDGSAWYAAVRKLELIFKPDRAFLYWWPHPHCSTTVDRTARVIALLLMQEIERDEP